MANTYTLKFPELRVVNDIDGMTDVVKEIHWRLEATDGGDPEVTAEAYGSSTIDDPEPGSFIAYGSVTVSNVKDWFSALVDEDGNNVLQGLKDGLDANIAAQKTPQDYNDTPDNTFTDGVSV